MIALNRLFTVNQFLRASVLLGALTSSQVQAQILPGFTFDSRR